MIERVKDRWQRKGTIRRGVEIVAMGIVAVVAMAVFDWLGWDQPKAEAAISVLLGYLIKLALPTEK